MFVGVGEPAPEKFCSRVKVDVGVNVLVGDAVSVGVGDSVNAADVAVRFEAAAFWLASAKTVCINGVAGVAEAVAEGVNASTVTVAGFGVIEGVNASIVAVAGLGVIEAMTVGVNANIVAVAGLGVAEGIAVGVKANTVAVAALGVLVIVEAPTGEAGTLVGGTTTGVFVFGGWPGALVADGVRDGVGENAGFVVFVIVGTRVFVGVFGGIGVFFGLLVGLGFLVGLARILLGAVEESG